MRVLVVDDDADLRAAVQRALRAAGISVDTAARLQDADLALAATAYDCVVLDGSLPGGDAVAYVEGRRAAGWTVPVLLLTARAPAGDVVVAPDPLSDVLAEPFAMDDVPERVRELARRAASTAPPVLRAGDLEVDAARHQARRGGAPLALTVKEFAVLEALVARLGQAVSRTELLAYAWDEPSDGGSQVIDVVIAQLRRKLGPRTPVETVRGVGYRMTVVSGAQRPEPSTPSLHAAEHRAGRALRQAVSRRTLGPGRAFLEGLATVFSFGMPVREPSSAGSMDAAVAAVADAARRVGRAGAG